MRDARRESLLIGTTTAASAAETVVAIAALTRAAEAGLKRVEMEIGKAEKK